MYIDTRLEDIKQLSTPLQWNGVQVFDKMKFFKGDGPAAQFEAGHQKGGDYFCWGCGIFASQVNHVAFSLNQPYISYSALMFNSPNISLKEANLDCYDILLCEPLHDVTGHIKNLFSELPLHMDKDQRHLFEEAMQAAFGGKDAKRGCDYRLALVLLTKLLYQSHLERIADFLLIVPPIWEVKDESVVFFDTNSTNLFSQHQRHHFRSCDDDTNNANNFPAVTPSTPLAVKGSQCKPPSTPLSSLQICSTPKYNANDTSMLSQSFTKDDKICITPVQQNVQEFKCHTSK